MRRTVNQSHTVIALLLHPSKAVERRMIQGIGTFAETNRPDWNLRIFDCLYPGRLASPGRWKVTGAICHSQHTELVKAASHLKVPTIYVGSRSLSANRSPGKPSREAAAVRVTSDDPRIGQMAVEFLAQRGHAAIGFLGIQETQGNQWSIERRVGVEAACRQLGLAVAHLCVPPMDLAIDHATLEHIAMWLSGLPKPVGIVACCDEFGRYAIEACGLANLSVPEQVAVLGVDNDELQCELVRPSLSSIDQNSTHEGYHAAELLAVMLDGERVPPGRYLVRPASVIERNSTAFIVTSDPYVLDAMAYIHANVHAIMDVKRIAEAIGISGSTLQRRFRETCGKSVHAMILAVRIRRATQLLVTTDLPLKVIAKRSGFRYPQYMTNVFTRMLGVTPLLVRQRKATPLAHPTFSTPQATGQ